MGKNVEKVLSCFVIGMLLMSIVPGSAVGVEDSNSNGYNNNLQSKLLNSFTQHVIPSDVHLFVEQIYSDSAIVSIYAFYDNITAVFMVNNITRMNNNFIIEVDSIKTGNATNLTSQIAYVTLQNLSEGNYSVEVIEKSLGVPLVNKSFTMEIFGLFLQENDLLGTLGTFKGGVENDTLYLMPFPRAFTCPPGIFKYTNFWVNSTEHFYLAVNLTNKGQAKYKVNFSLSAPISSINITPTNVSISTLNSNSFALCLFEIKNEDLPHGIYNITYNLNYTANGINYNVTGKIPMGVYELHEKWENNSVAISFISPFNDTINYTIGEWYNFPINGGRVWLPSNVSYSASYSNFTLQKPHSPWLHIVAGAVIGGIVCGGATALEQYLSGEEIQWDEVLINAAKGAVGGALIAGTFGVAGTAALGVMAKGAVLSGGFSAGLEIADQMLTTGKVYDWGDVFVNGLTSAVWGAGTSGIPYVAAYTHIDKAIKAGKYTKPGPWKKLVYDPWVAGNKEEAVFNFIHQAPPKSNIKQFVTNWDRVKKVSKLGDLLTTRFVRNKIAEVFEDPYGTFEVPVSTCANSFNSPFSYEDSDGDGILNIDEIIQGKDPFDPSDGPITLNILSPTSSNPAIVGDPSNPVSFIAAVSLNIPLEQPYFSAEVGGKSANVVVVSSNPQGDYYTLQIFPPTQSTEGSYNLNISVSFKGEMKDYDIEPDAVIYSTGGNIDVVEVIDRSGSMSGEKIQAAKDSAKLFVDLMRINDSIGVVSYSSSASVNYGLTKITSETIKQDAKNAIDRISAGGSTSIGAGLRAAYNELVNKGDPTRPRAIVLMSDGWQNTPPHPDEVLPDIKSANIRVFTIGLGAGADADLLSRIAHDTGGEYYYSPSQKELSAIYNAIAGVVKAESTVKTITGSVQQGETITHKVNIDPTINIATFTVTWTSGTLNLGLERPDGSKVDPSDPDVLSHTKGTTYETYTIDNPMIGEWTMKITAPSTSSSTKTATSNLINAAVGVITNETNNTMNDNWSTEIDVPARIMSIQKAVAQAGISYTATVTATTNLTVHIYTDKDKYSLNEPMKIITTLAKTGIPVTEANVNATIERSDNIKEYLSLYDDGKHGDCAALDGVYANYYTNTNVSGSYTITVHASGTASPEEFTREAKKSVYVSGAPAGEISVAPASWDVGIAHPGEDVISAFTVSSTSTKNETVIVSATDLTDAYGNVIGSENIISMPSTFVVPAGGSCVFYERIYVPETAKAGNYTGSIVLTSTANSVNIPITLQVKKLFETDIPNVELLYADPTVTSISVTKLNLSEINETYKPEECITLQSAYMINSTGAGNFTLRFTNIPNANTIIVYKIDPTSEPPNQWIELDATTTADTVTFTMSVEDPPVVFCSGAAPARVPALTPIGIIALAGLLAVVAVSRIRRKK